MKKYIARVREAGANPILLIGAESQAVDWPAQLPPPHIGEVYEIALQPRLVVLRRLGGPDMPQDRLTGDAMRWRQTDGRAATRMEILWKRHQIKRSLRDYLAAEGFIEIDMPLLVRGTTPDAHLDAFQVEDRYLVTSTDHQIRRMGVGGFDKVYTLTQNFRRGDTGTYRNPEFTMLEWERVGGDMHQIESDAEQFLYRAHRDLGGQGALHYQGREIDITPPWDRVSVKDAVAKIVGVPLEDFGAPALRRAVTAAGIELRESWADDEVFLFTVLLDHIQPFLGITRPVFLQEWPSFLTSGTRDLAVDRAVERSELFIAGIELSDGFPSPTLRADQIQGFADQQLRRHHEGKPNVMLDEKYLAAMAEGVAEGAGMAMGFDRLVMLLTDQPSIAQVLAFAWDEL